MIYHVGSKLYSAVEWSLITVICSVLNFINYWHLLKNLMSLFYCPLNHSNWFRWWLFSNVCNCCYSRDVGSSIHISRKLLFFFNNYIDIFLVIIPPVNSAATNDVVFSPTRYRVRPHHLNHDTGSVTHPSLPPPHHPMKSSQHGGPFLFTTNSVSAPGKVFLHRKSLIHQIRP